MRTLFWLTCLFFAPLQAGEIHKWVDADGNIHYGDAPPVNINSQNVRVQSAPSNPGRKLPRLLNANGDENSATANSAGARQGLDPNASPEEIACANAREDMEVIGKNDRIRLQAADGSSRFMTAEEIASRKAQAEADIQQFCQ